MVDGTGRGLAAGGVDEGMEVVAGFGVGGDGEIGGDTARGAGLGPFGPFGIMRIEDGARERGRGSRADRPQAFPRQHPTGDESPGERGWRAVGTEH